MSKGGGSISIHLINLALAFNTRVVCQETHEDGIFQLEENKC